MTIALPSSQEDREFLTNQIERAANLKVEQKTLSADIKEIAEEVNGKLGIKSREFGRRVKVRALQKIDEKKYAEEREAADVVFAENEILFGG